jgi:PadR family transcriptional regulator PadR
VIHLKKDTYECELDMALQKEFETSEIIIFSLLKKMQNEGLIKSGIKETSNRAEFKLYSITSEGKDQFENLKYEWYELNQTAIQFIG